MIAWVDGTWHDDAAQASVSVLDHGLLYGDGIFEGIRFYAATPFLLGEHLRRLRNSARCLALEILIDGYLEFLRMRPALVRLMAREALDGGRRLGPGPRHSVALEEGLTRFVRSLPADRRPSIDSEQLLITTVALVFFPSEHNDTMLAAMGLDATSERFSVARKRHVVDVLEQILAGA